MPFLLAEILNFQGSTHQYGVGSFSKLSKELGIKSEDCHFGYMDYEQLQKALNIMKSWGDFKIR